MTCLDQSTFYLQILNIKTWSYAGFCYKRSFPFSPPQSPSSVFLFSSPPPPPFPLPFCTCYTGYSQSVIFCLVQYKVSIFFDCHFKYCLFNSPKYALSTISKVATALILVIDMLFSGPQYYMYTVSADITITKTAQNNLTDTTKFSLTWSVLTVPSMNLILSIRFLFLYSNKSCCRLRRQILW